MCAIYKILLKIYSALLVLSLSGCAGSVKLPLNEQSHIQVAANPMGQNLQLTYNLYEKSHDEFYQFDPRLAHSIELKGLGALYVSNQKGSPAGERIEKTLAKLWEEGRPNGARIYDLVLEEVFYVEQPASKKLTNTSQHQEPAVKASVKKSFAKRARATLPPIAELPMFLFSSRPAW